MKIRNSIKAIIIKDRHILTMKGRDNDGDYFLLPGGGQEPGETMTEALQRECREEISCDIFVGDITLIREYISNNHEFAKIDPEIHQIEYMFQCKLAENSSPKIGHIPDNNQIGIEWLNLDKINQYRLYPRSLQSVFASLNDSHKIYRGDIN